MGRALFSSLYTASPAVAVRTEPEYVDLDVEKWSISNRFDPESDEFNRDAQREVFTDTEAYRQEREAMRALVAETGAESSESSEASDSDRGSPMAVGSDDPALLIADAYSNVDWEPRWLAGGTSSDWIGRRGSAAEGASDQARLLRVSRPRSATVSTGPVFLPPSSLRNSTTATEIETEASIAPPHSPTARRALNITPISIPNEPSSPSPVSPLSPSTPTDNLYAREMHSMLTPSPPPSVTPHIYTWQHRLALAVPTSPLGGQSTAGPLTNPSARMSLARINIAPARIRIQNAAV
ncbi:proline-rich protein [Lyophyllum atratum]|nr:proline-rich protein [Lyophyllum atratum]